MHDMYPLLENAESCVLSRSNICSLVGTTDCRGALTFEGGALPTRQCLSPFSSAGLPPRPAPASPKTCATIGTRATSRLEAAGDVRQKHFSLRLSLSSPPPLAWNQQQPQVLPPPLPHSSHQTPSLQPGGLALGWDGVSSPPLESELADRARDDWLLAQEYWDLFRADPEPVPLPK
jgi:hypothetical protein